MTAHRYTNVHDTGDGLWHVLPSDSAHAALDQLTKTGWTEEQIRLPVSIFIAGRLDPNETAETYRSVIVAMSEGEWDDKTLVSYWNTYNQLRYLEEHYEPQINQPV